MEKLEAGEEKRQTPEEQRQLREAILNAIIPKEPKKRERKKTKK